MNTVTIETGTLIGAKTAHGHVFYSIPYAAPPVGDLRFAPPAPPMAWEGVRDATRPQTRPWMTDPKPGAPVWQEFYADPDYLLPFDEDSLYVHVWTPADTPDEKRPVAVWIHGGAFAKGYGTEVETDGDGFASRGVILVSVEYRMAAFGFLCHPWLSAEQGGRSGNYGLMDQAAALRWVKKNIAAFGGDPDKVTIIGQSAGGVSVRALCASPQTEGLFRGAVMQSGGFKPIMGLRTLTEGESIGKTFTDFLGVRSLEELRAMPAALLTEKTDAFYAAHAVDSLTFRPVEDGWFLTEQPDEQLSAGRARNLSYLFGSNRDDFWAEALMDGRAAYARGLLDQGTPAYVYQFDRVLPTDRGGVYEGAFHSGEIWYVFETLGRCFRPFEAADHELSRRMADAWCAFVKTGSPDPDGELGWNPYRTPEDLYTFDVIRD